MTDLPVDTPAAPEPGLAFDMDGVTPRMLIDFREATGTSLMSFVSEDGELDLSAVTEEALAGVVWLQLRMTDAEVTYEQALDVPFVDALTPKAALVADPS